MKIINLIIKIPTAKLEDNQTHVSGFVGLGVFVKFFI